MKAGFDVYCEKPAAASYHDAKLMIDCAENWAGSSMCRSARSDTPDQGCQDMIARGDLGTPIS